MEGKPVDIAISFASADKDVAEKIHSELENLGINCFRYNTTRELSQDIGYDLEEYLSNIFFREASYCLMIISKDYSQSFWTGLEIDLSVLREFMDDNQGYIIPLLIDDTIIEGITDRIKCLNFSEYNNNFKSIAEAIIANSIHNQQSDERKSPPEINPQLYKTIIEKMSKDDFEWLCINHLFENQYGLAPNFRESGIAGKGPNDEKYFAEFTVKKRGLKVEFKNSLINRIRAQQALGDTTKKRLFNEILFYSPKPIFKNKEEKNAYVKEQLMPKIIEINQDYESSTPIIHTFSHEEIIKEISAEKLSSTKYFLDSKMNEEIVKINGFNEIEYFDSENDYVTLTEEEFYRKLHDYHELLPQETRYPLLKEILENIWSSVYDDHSFALKLLLEINDEEINSVTIKRLLLPICKMSIRNPLNTEDLINYFELIRDEKISGKLKHKFGLSRVLKQLIYTRDPVLNSVKITEKLNQIVILNVQYFIKLFEDLFLRYSVGFIDIPDNFINLLKEVDVLYNERFAGSVLSNLKNYIFNPIKCSESIKQDEFVDYLQKTIKRCEDVIDLRWCISCLLRILPLYERDEEEVEYADIVESLLENVNHDLFVKSKYAQEVFLTSLLRSYYRIKKLSYLKKYEKKFLLYNENLLPEQKHYLQLEYAASLYDCFNFMKSSQLRDLRFSQLIELGEDPSKQKLLSNKLIDKKELVDIDSLDSSKVFVWLLLYISKVFGKQASSNIKSNHLNVLKYSISTNTPSVRTQLPNYIGVSFKKHKELEADLSNSYFAKSTRVFKYINKNDYWNTIHRYINKAIEGNDYDIIRNAKSIGNAIYGLFYYSDIDKNYLNELISKYKEKSIIEDKKPKLHWAYYAGILYQNASTNTEYKFLDKLWYYENLIARQTYALVLIRDKEYAPTFPEKVHTEIKNWKKYSIFAKVLNEELINPEIWNIMATTVFNHRDEGSPIMLRKSAYFYSLAKCFTRSMKVHSQKYCYNFINCQSMVYKYSNERPSDFFIKDVAAYLEKPTSKYFSHIKACTEEYFKLLSTYWNNFEKETKLSVREKLSHGWIKEYLPRNLQTKISTS
ncbi:MAG: toll/interleukin-1 receptor domain-containing protein [Candidatus Marinimicrobia bacterium]|nr:toll/interleukin-1 receptor domain-containing protein [Candidatus Neomarinimicrobiota bacterium]MCF7829352.1 toll/interleukin-1 receptor domain-containing protein [Candidatus Neomarinimicrobiota bacterium]MCF7879985.1 toll/interleukin-1 receptor domain-containing protein [Candidatus Neomarinimicrobiota bacterium]